MRELANQQARAAIATHASKGSIREATWRWVVAAVFGGLTIFGGFNCDTEDYVTLSMVALGGCVTLFWAYLAVGGTKRYLAARRERRPKQAVAKETPPVDEPALEA
jgi:hypothetical protein